MVKVFSFPDVNQIIVSGDIHGSFETLVHKLCVRYQCKNTLLIVAGDCGFGFYKEGFYDTLYWKIERRLSSSNNYVVFVRGNHDDPSYFREEKVSHEHWQCIPDYSVINACGHHILCVGGAVSVDRKPRMNENAQLQQFGHTQTASWWVDEAPMFKPDEIAAIPDIFNVDTVVTHTSPTFCEPSNKEGLKAWAIYDPALVWECAKERETMDKILATLEMNHHFVERWFYGHFHSSWSEWIGGIEYTMLNILEFKEIC